MDYDAPDASSVLRVDGDDMLEHLSCPSASKHDHNARDLASFQEEDDVADPISLQRLVIDVKQEVLDDDAPTKSTGATEGHGNAASMADEPTHECHAHKKHRKERFLVQDEATGTWSCRDGATCKAPTTDSKREKKRLAALTGPAGVSGGGAASVSYNEISNVSNISVGANQTRAQTMFLCSVHRKLRSARNMSFTNGQWMCLSHMQCQLPSSDRAASSSMQPMHISTHSIPGYPPHVLDSSYSTGHLNSSTSFTRMPPPYIVQQQQQPPPHTMQHQQHHHTQYVQLQVASQPQPPPPPQQVVYVLPPGQQHVTFAQPPPQQQQPTQVVYVIQQGNHPPSHQQPTIINLPPRPMHQSPHQPQTVVIQHCNTSEYDGYSPGVSTAMITPSSMGPGHAHTSYESSPVYWVTQ